MDDATAASARAQRSSSSSGGGDESVVAVTVATHDSGYLGALRAGCARAGLPLHVLGYGQPWRGFGWRTQLVRAWLASRPADEVVAHVDAFDVLATLPHVDVLRQRFRAFGKALVLGVDAAPARGPMARGHRAVFGGVVNTASLLPAGAKARPRSVVLNGGSFMGTAAALRELYARLDAAAASAVTSSSSSSSSSSSVGGGIANDADDQRLLNTTANMFAPWFAQHAVADVDGVIFCNLLCGLSDAPPPVLQESDAGALVLRGLQVTPCFVHGAGNCDLDALALTAGLPLPARDTRRTRAQYLLGAVRNYAPYVQSEVAALLAWALLLAAVAVAVGTARRWGRAPRK